jgi:hypothetical protein
MIVVLFTMPALAKGSQHPLFAYTKRASLRLGSNFFAFSAAVHALAAA